MSTVQELSGVVAGVRRMPSHLHETVVEMFRRRPAFAASLLADVFGIDVPVFETARTEAEGLTDLIPTEYRADTVTVLSAGGRPVLAVVVEVQLGRDAEKRWSWPVHLTTLRSRARCPTMLLVVCVHPATAAWCAAPIALGHPGAEIAPLVLGPDRVPVVADAATAVRDPELTVLSAMAHGARPNGEGVLDALLPALETVDEHHASLYLDVVLSALPDAARRYLEALVTSGTYEYQTDFARRYFFEGRAEGEANAVLVVLDARGVPVDAAARARIVGCSDIAQLDAWVRRAVTVDSVDALFE